jgi:catechol 2,3-dioxygenase-like lactoylglutathione lyase family enzyme
LPLQERSMFKLAVPILGVSKSEQAEAFYCDKLGFRRKFAYRRAPDKADPCYMGIVRDAAHLVISSFEPDGPPGSRTVQIFVEDVAVLRDEFISAGVGSVSEILDQEWGNLEMVVTDPDGNRIGLSQVKRS